MGEERRPDRVEDGESPFLGVPANAHIAGNRLGFAIWDRFPVSRGHALVVPRRPIASWWEATDEERRELVALIDEVRSVIELRFAPDGFNVGFNSGAAAGQTVSHFHLHVIPRYGGDVEDPRGGIRHVTPGKGNYLASARTAVPPAGEAVALFDGQQRALEQELLRHLADGTFDRIDLVVSFIMRSGLELVDEALQDALDRGARVRILTTDYLEITEHAALARLLDLAEARPDLHVRVFGDPQTSFHPKAYLFWSSRGQRARVLVGSSNLSRSGLADGVEWNLGITGAEAARARFDELWGDPRTVS